ncbi:somatomedin-B and thrombospondin type-1 domain-containing protein-like isoform X1 [Myxocyprinus asiaticus]|uniref:somatomedin-B and thrombospondin type-1 domain-containing protein-like isoform X1 n=1 Tax=Myxocyprinus asiaticus TaxID=70543 RepID=UPI002223B620|nr:somatomedin-B and thrombospondin type-1 domain-containing protein-like isoform X1 [Myxocyprinus asiaticus]
MMLGVNVMKHRVVVFMCLMCVSGVCDAGCADRPSPRCCPGRNNECVEFTGRKTVCYCDTYCMRTGDCCDDYHTACHISAAIDCEVRQWGPWSPCSSVCGAGTTERSRQVATPPRNGGMPCPDLKQRRGCFAHTETCSAAKEVAKILPDSFKRNFKDPWRRPHMLMKEEKKSYCVHMRVKQVSAACKVKMWSAQLVRERSVCVECQSDAMATDNLCRGDGLKDIRTFWTAASAPGCSGSWVRESSAENCQCPPYSVLFV